MSGAQFWLNDPVFLYKTKKPPTKVVVYKINHFSGFFIAPAIDFKSALMTTYYK